MIDPRKGGGTDQNVGRQLEGQITWAVQEITFVNGPPGLVPTFTFTAPVVPADHAGGPFRSADSPGAIAGGDLDRAVDTDGNYHDEIVMATECYCPPGGGATGLPKWRCR